jgi:hypothetical protein
MLLLEWLGHRGQLVTVLEPRGPAEEVLELPIVGGSPPLTILALG